MSGWTCASCGGANPEGMRFCGHCGAAAAREWTCASCGGANSEGMRFCGHCGKPAAAAPPEVVPPEPTTTPGSPGAAGVTEALRSFVAAPVADRLVEEGGRLEEERRLITALFADISGFTPLADRLDAEELLEVIDPVVSTLSSVVGRYDGFVEKYAGDALLALFGAPVTHEDDAARALLVALEMHRVLGDLAQTLPDAEGLTLHVGVNSGHGVARLIGSSVRTDYGVLGDSVILAQRLESAAPPGETYVSDSTYRLTSDWFEFEPVGELTLKGKTEPIRAWRLVGERRRTERLRAQLVGRERELAEVTAELGRLDERGGILVLTGEPGIGKTRLAAEAEVRAEAREVRWLQMRCLSYGAGLPYWPFADLLRRVGVADGAASPFFVRLAGGEAPELAHLEPEALRRGLHDAFAHWLRTLARESPTVLAVEDVHWADASSLALVADLARLCGEVPLLLFLVGRPEAEAHVTGLLPPAALRLLRLEPLDEGGVARILEVMLEAPPPPRLTTFIAARASGNPFFVQELVRTLQDSGTLLRDDGGWRLQPGWDTRELPPTVEEVLSARIDMLPHRETTVLQTAAVVGRRIRLSLLRAVAADVDGLDEALDHLVASAFLEHTRGENGDAEIAFPHALVQDAAYDRLLRRRRRELHRRVADAAEALYGAGDDAIDLLARHLYLARAGEKAVEYLVRAAARARRLFANEEAILHLARAAELAPERPAILFDLADLHELVGNYDEALRLYGDLRDTTGDVRAWRGVASTLRKRGRYDEALTTLDEAASLLDGAVPAAIWLDRAWTLAAGSRFDDAIEAARAGLAAEDGARDEVAAQLLLQLTRAETVEGRLDEALAHGLEAKAIFEQAGSLRGLATALRLLGDAYRDREEFDEAAAVLRRGLEIAERVGSAEEIGGCLINLGVVELRRGNLREAIEFDRLALTEFERVGNEPGCAIGYANLAEMLLHVGDLDQAVAMAERALELASSLGMSLVVADTTQTFAAILLEQGRAVEAGERAEEAAARFEELGANPLAAASLDLAAKAWERAGAGDRASAVLARAGALAS